MNWKTALSIRAEYAIRCYAQKEQTEKMNANQTNAAKSLVENNHNPTKCNLLER